ncbi:hypothetical protein CHS0354_018786 [Potamilus streckersoni]|uniref:Uncharacterized protein n=1 Tax=Potamilus streckersoni TaxID=2493646 RepID=A0AAE0WAP7_9BIVA|nr:hypothetical protein CHS0354_018786 [Potamilus streckersoni]
MDMGVIVAMANIVDIMATLAMVDMRIYSSYGGYSGYDGYGGYGAYEVLCSMFIASSKIYIRLRQHESELTFVGFIYVLYGFGVGGVTAMADMDLKLGIYGIQNTTP